MESVRLKINEHMTSVGEEILCVLDKQRCGADVCCVKLVSVFVLERLSAAAEFLCNLFQREIDTRETLLEKQNKHLDIDLHTADQCFQSSSPARTVSIKQETTARTVSIKQETTARTVSIKQETTARTVSIKQETEDHQMNSSPARTVSIKQETEDHQMISSPARTVSIKQETEGHLDLNPVHVPVVAKEEIQKMVQDILLLQQQQLQQQPRAQTKKCLSCGQPKSRYSAGDGSSIHFFYQNPPVRYFYCSTKVFKAYSAEGLTNPKMSFEEFALTEFFQRELDSTKQRVESKARLQKKRKLPDTQPRGRLCRFCHQGLKQGPNSPHLHTGFPGVTGKYIYCPSKVLSLYKDKGMAKEMSWKKFKQSSFYDMEKDRWTAERKK